ncbi:hypothetical protein BKA62DRAFT_682728 [Auriculariales sp. MPI-PUGE-AT-0066]|nr:hypothetical protein BKA62DRAFT_682728 [Auriculariales sp. MPI-PUGE-AT-0066]
MVNVSSFFFAVVALVGAVAAADDGPQVQFKSVQPASPAARVISSRDTLHVERMTNAKRMAAGLPINPPHRRNHADLAARHPKPSSSPVPGRNLDGYVQISNANNGKFLGYIGKAYQVYGEYGPVNKINKALKVSVQGVSNHKSGPLQIVGKNGDKTYPNLGGLVGYASTSDALTAGNSNYLYIGGVQQTGAGSSPVTGGSAFFDATSAQAKVESAVWQFNSSNRKITLQWVNPDGSITNGKLVLYKPDNVLLAVGDIKAFRQEFGGPTVPVVLTLIGA